MTRAISSGIPLGVTGLEETSSLGDTCMCTSLHLLPDVVTTSTRTKFAFTVAFPKNGSVGTDRQKQTGVKFVQPFILVRSTKKHIHA